ncbi:unnamed protein product [Brassica napus]|uniref:Uncharacterized protein n=2 Tax=Brassica TaxID=3705 RepID=A0A3P6FXW6_BRAOL|nr:unnamed protein product [Brassica napus]VDD49232.1 unnamed protein product [Brassica oleracea]
MFVYRWKYRRRTQLYSLTDYAGGLKAGSRIEFKES